MLVGRCPWARDRIPGIFKAKAWWNFDGNTFISTYMYSHGPNAYIVDNYKKCHKQNKQISHQIIEKGNFPRIHYFQSNIKQFGPKPRKRLYFEWKWRRLVVVLLFLYLLSVQPPDLYFTSQTREYISFFHALLIYFYHFLIDIYLWKWHWSMHYRNQQPVFSW